MSCATARRLMVGVVALLSACAPPPAPLPAASGPTYAIAFAADPITTPDQALQGARRQAQAQCAAMGKSVEMVDEQQAFPRTPGGGTAFTGTLRFRCY